jgi:hypothetical protein
MWITTLSATHRDLYGENLNNNPLTWGRYKDDVAQYLPE